MLEKDRADAQAHSEEGASTWNRFGLSPLLLLFFFWGRCVIGSVGSICLRCLLVLHLFLACIHVLGESDTSLCSIFAFVVCLTHLSHFWPIIAYICSYYPLHTKLWIGTYHNMFIVSFMSDTSLLVLPCLVLCHFFLMFLLYAILMRDVLTTILYNSEIIYLLGSSFRPPRTRPFPDHVIMNLFPFCGCAYVALSLTFWPWLSRNPNLVIVMPSSPAKVTSIWFKLFAELHHRSEHNNQFNRNLLSSS